MTWSSYLSYVAFAAVLVLVPGADFAVIVKNTLAGGARRGRWSAAGVASSNAVQGLAAVAGLGAVIVHYQPLFQAIKWAGIGYLVYLAIQTFRSAWAGRYAAVPGGAGPVPGPGRAAQARAGWRQGFLSNITNPKVLVFYLAVLPQFIGPSTPLPVLLVVGLSHALLSLTYLLVVVTGLHRVRGIIGRRRIRRALDAVTGTLLLGFGVRLAAEQT
ncbi:LysE family translocator [Polymorphospora rubra]|uniref:Threonine efflux protein n=1 Tax=Polymorphospora rubra TaxID=338584 RepID=A0A810N3E6_9ACTN|nr:LysE family translocator [Polymorphospora rubra]BCJ67114.1 threonine efflux protein [Polymorphospora rubra]